MSLLRMVCAVVVAVAAMAGAAQDEAPELLGRCGVDELRQEPFAEWFVGGYDDYAPNATLLESLRRSNLDDVSLDIFFGTWCGDSRSEVPRWLKLLHALDLEKDRVSLIAVDGDDALHKRSPGGEEHGLEIYRVPTVIVRRGGSEIARVVEYPVLSIERDLLAILEGRPYEPNYATYPTIRRWLEEGLLADPNVSPRGLAGEIRSIVSGEGELAAAARVLQFRGDTAEAVKLAQANCALHRDSSRCQERLAEALLLDGDLEPARQAAERALRLNDDPERVEALVQLVERSRPQPSTPAQQVRHQTP